jgi:hypothetical protein
MLNDVKLPLLTGSDETGGEMPKPNNGRSIALAGVLIVSCMMGAQQAGATELITNGGFEAGGGSFTGWTHLNEAGSFPGSDWFIQSGTVSPTSGFPVPAPPDPTHAAMTDQGGPGSHVLFQNFTVPVGVTSGTLSFDRFIGNRDGPFATPSSLDFSVVPNQQARVDILVGAPSSEFSVLAADVLANVFQTHTGDPLVSGYTLQMTDLTSLLQAHQGQTLQLRFAEVDNQSFFQFGADAVSLNVSAASVPEPSSLVIFGSALLAWRLSRRRRYQLIDMRRARKDA